MPDEQHRVIVDTNPSIYAARKRFYDWLDERRLWARPGCDIYQAMEQMVDAAAVYFRFDCRLTQEDMKAVEADLLMLTATMSEHPAGYDGPCACEKCQAEG